MKPGKRRDLLREHAENIRISRKLVELCREVPLPVPLEELRVREPDRATLGSWLLAMGFRSTANRLGLAEGTAPPSPEPETLEVAPEQPPFGPYECVTTPDRLQAWIAEARKAGVIGLDTETDGLDPTRATLIGIGLATGPGPRLLHPAAPPARRAGGAGLARRRGAARRRSSRSRRRWRSTRCGRCSARPGRAQGHAQRQARPDRARPRRACRSRRSTTRC